MQFLSAALDMIRKTAIPSGQMIAHWSKERERDWSE
jgi:hypothetical protein